MIDRHAPDPDTRDEAPDDPDAAESSQPTHPSAALLREFFSSSTLTPGRTPKASVTSDSHDWTSHGDDTDGAYYDRLTSDDIEVEGEPERDLTRIFRHETDRS